MITSKNRNDITSYLALVLMLQLKMPQRVASERKRRTKKRIENRRAEPWLARRKSDGKL